MTIELTASAQSEQVKNHLASSSDDLIRKKLLKSARLSATNQALLQCRQLRGQPANYTCVRDAEYGTDYRWGGRVGYEVFEADVEVSVKCRLNLHYLSWSEEQWYSLMVGVLDPCPKHLRFKN